MKLIRSTKSKITKNSNGENVLHLEITEVVLIHCSIVNIDYQQDSTKGYQNDSSKIYTFVPNKSFGEVLHISLKNFIFLKTFKWEFSYIEVRFPDQNSKPLEVEETIRGRINITLVIN